MNNTAKAATMPGEFARLSTEHAASSHCQPVLLISHNTSSEIAYGQYDIIPHTGETGIQYVMRRGSAIIASADDLQKFAPVDFCSLLQSAEDQRRAQ